MHIDRWGEGQGRKVNNTSEEKTYNATAYGFDCPGYGSDETKLIKAGTIQLSEDCLNLNIIRPWRNGNDYSSGAARDGARAQVPGKGKEKAEEDELLPVLLWIYGGGWQQGATADPRYIQCSIFRSFPLYGIAGYVELILVVGCYVISCLADL